MGMDQTQPDFDHMPHQSGIYTELAYIFRTQRIPNALLFSGRPNTGRKKAASWLAKSCNCDNPSDGGGCGTCRSCRKIDGLAHPDMLQVDLQAAKKNISISQIRQMGTAIAARPNEARYRMVLIDQAHTMNIQAQNALLKMLEEPPQSTFFVLVCDTAALLLPTIISRCRHLRFRPPPDCQIRDWLVREQQMEPAMARIISKTADGDIKKARAWSESGSGKDQTGWFGLRKSLLNTLSKIMMPAPGENIRHALALSQVLIDAPEILENSLVVVRTFFRDLMIFSHAPEKLVNLDFYDTFADINTRRTSANFTRWMNLLFDLEVKLASNCSPRLALDTFFLQIVSDKGRIPI